jgi:hypothetical protein
MNKNYTLKELADIGLNSACQFEPNSKFPLSFQNYREAFTKAVLDAIGYEFPKDEEREAFERWRAGLVLHPEEAAFEAWKAGREELRRFINKHQYSSPEQMNEAILGLTPKEPAWIPWEGGECPLEDGMIWEAKLRSGTHVKAKGLACRRDHNGRAGDIVAYRVWEG